MKLAVPRTSSALAVVATAGASTLFLGAAPAFAATEACGATGDLIAPGICELTLTSGSGSFATTPQMTKLEVLLVGAGGSGADQPTPNTNGYAAAGGGGEVKIVDFSGATTPLTYTVPAPAAPGSITDGVTLQAVGNGADAAFGSEVGGASGSGNPGASGVSTSTTPYGAGGGAGASPANNADGGAGVVVSSIAPSGSLFTGDAACYGGGGAIGFPGTPSAPAAQGVAGCGGGHATDATGTALTPAVGNSGGGGGGLNIAQAAADRAGASGVIVIRWSATPVSLSFAMNGHGPAFATQSVVPGTAPTRPADPVAADFEFQGWFSDAALTVPADFAAPLTASTSFYAKWVPALAATGGAPDPSLLPIGVSTLLAGLGLVIMASRRPRSID